MNKNDPRIEDGVIESIHNRTFSISPKALQHAVDVLVTCEVWRRAEANHLKVASLNMANKSLTLTAINSAKTHGPSLREKRSSCDIYAA